MNLSVSNIAWSPEHDGEVYRHMQELGFSGLEIAPTRIFPEAPYEHLGEAEKFSRRIKEDYGLEVCSMQSIWYGKTQNIAGSPAEYEELYAYTVKAVKFAAVLGCKNIVFGCPKNRRCDDEAGKRIVEVFLREAAHVAERYGVFIAVEPNPEIYGTNFINTTTQAVDFVKDNPPLKINLDFGTIIENNEDVNLIRPYMGLVNHVHISEPFLEPVRPREAHKELRDILRSSGGKQFVSIEMKNTGLENLYRAMDYLKGIFGE